MNAGEATASPARAATTSAGRRCRNAALALLLACLAARCTLDELPFGGSALQFLPAAPAATMPAGGLAEVNPLAFQADRTELARLAFASGLLAACGLWLWGSAADRRLAVHDVWLAGLIGLFAVPALVSALTASDARAALNGWLDQVALLAAGWTAMQLCRDRRRFAVVVVVLAAVGGMLAVKAAWQRGVEIPARIEDFRAHRAERLAAFGWQADTPQADLIEARLMDTSVTGFASLANPFASTLLVLGFAAAGLAVARVRLALKGRDRRCELRRPGELDARAVAAGAAVLLAVAVLAVVPFTRSRGGMLAGAVGLLLAAVVLRWAPAIGRHWRKLLVAAAAVGVLAGGAVVGYGLARDRLPTKTMTFRWHYWTGAAAILAERPSLGVGEGNFASAYLRHRRDEAEEEIKMPHNLLAHALTSYGLVGGAALLGAIGWLVVGSARPAAAETGPTDKPPDDRPPSLRWTALAVVAAVALAWWAFRPGSDPALTVIEGAATVVVLAGLLILAAWGGDRWLLPAAFAPAARAILACGLAAFVIHNAVTFSLWLPAPATVFFVAAGACAGAGGGTVCTWRVVRWSLLALPAIALALVIALWWPVVEKTRHTAAMLDALAAGETRAALASAIDAAKADRLDPRPAADAARAAAIAAADGSVPTTFAFATARTWADRAIERDPASSSHYRLAGRVALAAAGRGLDDSGAVTSYLRAIERNPKDARLHIEAAEAILGADWRGPRMAIERLDEALRLDAVLPPESVQKLRPAERGRIEALRAKLRRRRSHR